jgi:hypothetical protein
MMVMLKIECGTKKEKGKAGRSKRGSTGEELLGRW